MQHKQNALAAAPELWPLLSAEVEPDFASSGEDE
jgi:hypothetical protein